MKRFRRPSNKKEKSSGDGVVTSHPRMPWARRTDPGKAEKLAQANLLKAVERGAITTVKQLLEDGTKPVCFGVKGTPLHYASANGHMVVTSLLLTHGAPANILGDTNYAPLHIASRAGHTTVAELLLKNGANPDILSKFEKRTPLQLAAAENHLGMITLLLANEAKVERADIYGTTALHQAARAGHLEAVQVLLHSRSEVNMQDKEGWTALHLAAQGGHTDTVKCLLEADAVPDCVNKYGRTPLHWACANGQLAAAEVLLTAGADVNLPDINGKTAIAWTTEPHLRQLVGMYDSPAGRVFQIPTEEENFGTKLVLQPCISIIESTQSTQRQDSNYSTSTQATRSRISVYSINSEELKQRRISTQRKSSKLEPMRSMVGEMDQAMKDTLNTLDPMFKEQVLMTRQRLQMIMSTMDGLFMVAGSHADEASGYIIQTLEGKVKKSYMDVLRELYEKVQKLCDNLVDFKEEIAGESQTLANQMQALLKLCVQQEEEKVKQVDVNKQEDTARSVRLVHFLAPIIASYSGLWRSFVIHLDGVPPRLLDYKFLNDLELKYSDECNRAYDILYLYNRTCGLSASRLGMNVLKAVEKSNLEGEEDSLLDSIKQVMANSDPPDCDAGPVRFTVYDLPESDITLIIDDIPEETSDDLSSMGEDSAYVSSL